MRNLKFKAYCTDRDEWVNIIDLGMFSTGEVREVAYTYDSEPYERYDSRVSGENIILVQSTGMYDKNGKEIFDKDYLEISGHPLQRRVGEFSGMNIGIDIDGVYQVHWSEESAGYIIGNWRFSKVCRHCEVIEINSKTELLEEEQHEKV